MDMEEHRRRSLHGGGERMGITFWLVYTLFITSGFVSNLSSAAFTPSTSLFLNCGSDDNFTDPKDPRRTFLPDSTSDSLSLSSSSSSYDKAADHSNSSGTSPLYRTARVFKGPSSYEIKVLTTGVHVLRLHFFPFVDTYYDLFSAVFSVTTLERFQLLSNFSVSKGTGLPVIKEYFLYVDSPRLGVTFTPSTAGDVAFVSAVEVFTAPRELFPEQVIPFAGLWPVVVLETVHRINMGGPRIEPSNDSLWRTWDPDDVYLLDKDAALEVRTTANFNYRDDDAGSTVYIAPRGVYSTARAMNNRGFSDPHLNNITWQFNVSTGASYLVRMHFYDLVSWLSGSPDFFFNAYVNGVVVIQDIQPSSFNLIATIEPFYHDSVVGDNGGAEAAAGGTRVMRVSVGPSARSSLTVNATLNGLEIMRILNSTVPPPKKKNKNLHLLVVSAVGGLALLALLVGGCSLLISSRLGRQRPPERRETTTGSWSPLGKSVTPINLGLHIPYEEIRFATNDFDEGLVVGSGGFGRVYRGVLRDGTVVAVKRSTPGSTQGFPEFQREVMVLSMIRHRHLVSLVGYCVELEQMILVYEFMEKGTLRSLLYSDTEAVDDTAAAPCLSWKQRLEICIGAARGIHYLHTSGSQGIIHRDLKSTNILLGTGYLAKVSDFGLSRLGPTPGQTHVSTGVKGSFGYLDPEYFKTQQLTEKSDVYSFGVVLFEVLCARPALDQRLPAEEINLAEWAATAKRLGRVEQVVDPRIRGAINPRSMSKFVETAMQCLEEDGVERPAMGDVLWSLEYCLQLQETEVRREAHEDSGVVPVPVVVRRIPSIDEEVEADGGAARVGEKRMTDSSSSSNDNSKVFSQLFVREGR